MNYNPLTPEEERIILYKGTEAPFSGKYYNFDKKGTYHCKRCNAELYKSSDKFDSHCGWPSFDDEIQGAIKRVPDADGKRTEIVCSNCGAHLGHVFEGEGFTPKNTRHCVNSLSIQFLPLENVDSIETTYFAGGCFWGVEYYMQKAEGIISTDVGFMGGKTRNPSYKDVCTHTTGHAEVVKVVFNNKKTSFEQLARLFFEIHDPTQMNRQGPDIGDQYRSEIFYTNEKQKEISLKLIQMLKAKGVDVVTGLTPATEFYIAEDYHQDYYNHKGTLPYCHGYQKRF
ncbi:MAG TPA: bifunctional methionine sulfoxide reductase B/A protein [Bacteroidales bacterium]|nr:bifunctional methionine sulfoxide reductase B/A protein [Bacteroidales bacterium]